MDILFELLNELKYQSQETFPLNNGTSDDAISTLVTPFVSSEYPCQTYLVVDEKNNDLSKINDDYFKNLATSFRKARFHESDMDKNTTLIIRSIRSDKEPLNIDAKVKIEDDPYYFKKYVFSYTFASEKLAETYLENKKTDLVSNFSYVDEVLKYLMMTKNFSEYRDNSDPLSTYSYFAELVTKVPAFPLNINNSENIKSVSDFLSEKLTESEIDIELLDKIAYSNINFKEDSLDLILSKYNEIIKQ